MHIGPAHWLDETARALGRAKNDVIPLLTVRLQLAMFGCHRVHTAYSLALRPIHRRNSAGFACDIVNNFLAVHLHTFISDRVTALSKQTRRPRMRQTLT